MSSDMFFKTKLCANFMAGTCHNGLNCSFAHGRDDMRFPPPNWRQLVARGGHPSTENDQKRMQLCKIFQNGKECPYGETCIFQHECPTNLREDNDLKFSERKAKICIKYETTGNCPFGRHCHFAHGQAEVQVSRGHTQTRVASQPPTLAPASIAANGTSAANVGQCIDRIAQEKGLGKVSRIYGDWPDMFPPN